MTPIGHFSILGLSGQPGSEWREHCAWQLQQPVLDLSGVRGVIFSGFWPPKIAAFSRATARSIFGDMSCLRPSGPLPKVCHTYPGGSSGSGTPMKGLAAVPQGARLPVGWGDPLWPTIPKLFRFDLSAVVALVAALSSCAPALPPLMDTEAMCGKLRADRADFASCAEDVRLVNEQRIEAYRQIYGSVPTAPSAPSFYAPAAATLSSPPSAPTTFQYIPPQDYTPHPPPTVLCVGLVPIPGGSNAEGMQAGCH
jgi:hypothetical protein